MIVFLINVYLVILFLLVRLKIVRFNLFWKVSPAIVLVLLMFGLFIPMGWGAPTGTALVIRNSVPIVPNVAAYVVSNRPPNHILTERAERVLVGTRRWLGDGSWCAVGVVWAARLGCRADAAIGGRSVDGAAGRLVQWVSAGSSSPGSWNTGHPLGPGPAAG